jgi:uncharacterized membrane protein YphA (DoxX/SURF4 family)
MNATVVESDSWWARHARVLKTAFRLFLGIAWLTDGILKFTSGYVNDFLSDVQNSQSNAPSWLSGWYSFWVTQATNNGTLIVYTVGTLEVMLGLALIFGFMRKIAYGGGVILSLLIWAIPEGFGGPYTNGSGTTDIGTGVIYAIAFLGLIVINATYGSSRFSIDYLIERAYPRWAKIAEFGSGAPARVINPPSTADVPPLKV